MQDLQIVTILMNPVLTDANADGTYGKAGKNRGFRSLICVWRSIGEPRFHCLPSTQIDLFLFGRNCISGQVSMFHKGGSIMETGYLYGAETGSRQAFSPYSAGVFIKKY
jgi:hypothetical protein